MVRLVRPDGTVVREVPLAYAGEPSTYDAEIRLDEAGEMTLEVLALQPAVANFGLAQRALRVEGKTRSGAEPGRRSGDRR